MMPHHTKSLLCLSVLLALAACSNNDGGTPPGEPPVIEQDMLDSSDVSADISVVEDMPKDVPTDKDMVQKEDMDTEDQPEMDASEDMDQDMGPVVLPDYPSTWPRGRGWSWVRENDTFITALSVRMGAPPVSSVDRYFNDFNATAVHLWQTGMPTAIAGWKAGKPDARWLTWVDRNGNSSENNLPLGGAARPSGLIGYQVGDEPRDRPHFNDIIASLGTIKATDPQPLRVFNFTTEAPEIDAFLQESCANGDTDVFSYDYYSFGNNHFESLMKVRRAAIACGIPYWRYIKSFEGDYDRRKNYTQSDSSMRWDAFAGLLAGYTGHTWFLYNVKFGAAEGIPTTLFTETEMWGATPTPQFGFVAQINKELAVYGKAQTKLRSTSVAWVPKLSIPFTHPPDGVGTWQADDAVDDRLVGIDTANGSTAQDAVVGFFEDRYKDTYVMVMNPNHTHGDIPNNKPDAADVILNFKPNTVQQLKVLRPTGVVEAVAVQNNTVTFNIKAGDVVFYKYATGNGFEGYR